ncbi:unnamed protein product [Meganyctiphanes norvegica]|uniref:Uncharacterized protein n=1 Tax=Meganyctiphanes norvegica TaxID=48144 RepID=A0AAV2S6W0_MEGNR
MDWAVSGPHFKVSRFKMRVFVALLVALCIMLQMLGYSEAAPQPEPVAAPWPNPFPYTWEVMRNFANGAIGTFKASSENKEAPCTDPPMPSTT